MDLHKLKIFEAIARLGSFSRAAESVFVTQPTASQQIAQLEASLGVRLFERGARRATLTPAGEALIPYAEQILLLVEMAADSARSAAGVADVTLRLGVGHTLATYLLPGLFRDYRAAHPERRIKLTIGNTGELLAEVAAGTVEIALIGTPAARDGVRITPFMRDRIVAVYAPSAAPESARIRPESLLSDTLIIREPGSALHAAVEGILGRAALESDSVIELGETEAIKRSVEAGLGVALIQEMAVREEAAADRLAVRELDGVDDQRTYAYAHKANGTLSIASQDLIEQLTVGT